LAAKLNELSKKNKILISNFDLDNVKDLFPGSQWNFKSVQQSSNISGTNSGRKKMEEVLIYNY